jgi:hypothetical protein
MKRYLLVLVAVLIPAALQAQEPEQLLKGLERSALSTVFVLDDAGVETRGQLLRLDPDAIVVLVNGSERRFDTRRVARVSRRGDSLKNGAIAGLVVGIASAVGAVATIRCEESCNRGLQIAWLTMNTAVYTAVGTGIDAAVQGRTVLYRAPAPRAVVQSRGAAALSVRWTW